MTDLSTMAEPYKIKMVESIRMTTRQERERAMKEAGWNTFLLKSEDVWIDLLTDSGTTAMSDYQWAGMMLGDEAYAGSRNYYFLEEVVHDVMGYKHLVPTHQGRGAENIMSKCLINQGDHVPGNMYFTTTRQHQEMAGATFHDVIIDEAHDPYAEVPFKGNVDIAKLERLVNEVGAAKIPYITVGAPVNLAGGQPVSMANMREVSKFCHKHGIKVIIDAARILENCWFIKQREKGFEKKGLKEICREFCGLSDGCTMSAKKDAYVNIGGWLSMNDDKFFEKAKELVVVYEGLHTYGGMAGRDMEAVARGFKEAAENESIVSWRIRQVEYLYNKLVEADIPVVRPFGGHAVFLDARAFFPQIPQDAFPAQRLAAEIYLESGVRTMERGVVSAGRDHATGKHHYPKLELVRVTIPRRVYTNNHMDVTAEAIKLVWRRRGEVKGLKFTYEPESLRFFQGRFEPL